MFFVVSKNHSLENLNCHTVNASEFANSSPQFKGLPGTFILSSLFTLIFIIWFVSCRYYALKFQPNTIKKNLFQFIFGHRNIGSLHPLKRIKRNHQFEYSSWILNYLIATEDCLDPSYEQRKKSHDARLGSPSYSRVYLQFWRFKLTDFRDDCGRDAYHYLKFQLKFIALMTFCAMLIILFIFPTNLAVNLGPGARANFDNYDRTVMTRFVRKSHWKIVHVFLAILISCLSVAVNLTFILDYIPGPEGNDNVVLVKNVGQELRNEHEFLEYFASSFHFGIRVEKIFLTYELEDVKGDLFHIQEIENLIEVLGDDSLKEQCVQLRDRMKDALYKKIDVALKKPANALFVRFRGMTDAKLFSEIHEMQRLYIDKHPESEIFKHFKQHSSWNLRFAPDPWDVHFDTVCLEQESASCKRYSLYVILFFVFAFLSTPMIAVTYIKDLLSFFHVDYASWGTVKVLGLRYNLATEITSWLLLTMTVILPKIVASAADKIPVNFHSERDVNILNAIFAFLNMMILIFPSLGLVSFDFFVENIVFHHQKPEMEMGCFFNADSATFFVHYILSSTGFNFMELCRFGEMIMAYAQFMVFTQKDKECSVSQYCARFKFGYVQSYALCLLIINISFAYCISCPLILPVGVLFLLTKHIVDRLNLYLFYECVDMFSYDLHMRIIDLCHYPALFMLIQLFFTLTAAGQMDSPAGVLITLWLMIYIWYMFYGRDIAQNLVRTSPHHWFVRLLRCKFLL